MHEITPSSYPSLEVIFFLLLPFFPPPISPPSLPPPFLIPSPPPPILPSPPFPLSPPLPQHDRGYKVERREKIDPLSSVYPAQHQTVIRPRIDPQRHRPYRDHRGEWART